MLNNDTNKFFSDFDEKKFIPVYDEKNVIPIIDEKNLKPVYDEKDVTHIIDEKEFKSKRSNGMLASSSKLPEFITNPHAATMKKAEQESALDVYLIKKNNKQFDFSKKKNQK